jgi:acid phosphatase
VRSLPLRAAILAALALAAVAAPASAHPNARVAAGVSDSTPCVGAPNAPSRVQHVIVLFMENQPYNAVIGSPQAPYVNHLAQICSLGTNYHNITHPSAPEYLTVTSGELGGAGDCPPVFLDPSWPPTCPDSHNNIFHQTMAAGETWKNYEESMRQPCFEGEDSSAYDINHNPAAYYTDLGGPSGEANSPCDQFDVSLGTPTNGNFERDLAHGTLPSYSFIAPNLIHDTHDSNVATGDKYLSQLLPTIFNSAEYQDGTTVLFLTWDEGENGATDKCAYNTTDIGCHVPMIVASPWTVPGTVSATLFNHYALLKTDEQLLGLPLLGHARDARVKSMVKAFGL